MKVFWFQCQSIGNLYTNLLLLIIIV